MNTLPKAALFDLDGVVIDTESQYSLFWGSIGRQYRPDVPDFAERKKHLEAVAVTTAQMHENGFLHKDYSGGNILLTEMAEHFHKMDEWLCRR